MKVLSIEQMNRLKKLGVDVAPKAECIMYSSVGGDDYKLMYGQSVCEDDMMAFTLQDIIELLPKTISNTLGKASLLIAPNCLNTEYQVMYVDGYGSYKVMHQGKCILDAAYNMLIWVIENGHLKTK